MALIPKLFCWQVDPQLFVPPSGTEDCLYLNIFRPKGTSVGDKLPIIVFQHGGGFYSGTNNPLFYGPDYLMDTGEVILVTITHRQGPFGFLATGDHASPGNYGLKDQTMALRWINKYIESFGGDPEKVTIMGHSAGGISMGLHLVSKQSKGLYNNVYMTDGSGVASWGQPMKDPRGYINQHARIMGIPNPEEYSNEEIVEKFRGMSALKLTSSLSKLTEFDYIPITNYLPSIEPEDSPDPFLTEDPIETLLKGDIVKVPVMSNLVPGSAINFVQPLIRSLSRYKEFNADIYRLLPLFLGFNSSHPNNRETVDRIRFKYLAPDGFVTKENFDDVLRMGSDYLFGRPFYQQLKNVAKHSDKPVYGHNFEYRGQNSLSKVFTRSLRDFGVVHADDLLYLFRIRLFFPLDALQLSPKDRVAQKVYLNDILNFVKNDDPGYGEWEEEDPKMAYYRNNDETIIQREMEPADDYEFWDEVRAAYGKEN